MAQQDILPTDAGDTSLTKIEANFTELYTAKDNLEVVVNNASSSAPASLDLHEDTDNGTNKITVTAPSAVASDKVLTLPDATDTLVGKDTTDTLTNKTLSAPVVRAWSGWEDANETWTYSSADGSTGVFTVAADVTTKYSAGMRVKYQQEQALSYYWTFNSSSAADVGSATMADIGTPTYTAGKFGNALTLNGTNQALSITDAAGFKPTGEFTLGMWFKKTGAGTQKMLFQSYSQNANAAGIFVTVESTNVLKLQVGKNTGTTVGKDLTQILGTTNIADNVYHYLVVSYRNNYAQVYVDGNLEMSGYCFAPAYAATNYVRIGCYNPNGSNSLYFDGQIDDLFLINGYALDEKTIKAKYAAGTAQGTGNITVQKYGIITKDPTYSAPNTSITIWGGTDYSTANATISNPYYSPMKAPFGFPLNPAKWTVKITNSTNATQASPVSGTYYNLGSINISVPIGEWKLWYIAPCNGYHSAGSPADMVVALSTTNNSASDQELITWTYVAATQTLLSLTTEKTVSLSSKTTYYLNAKTENSGLSSITFQAGNSNTITIIRAISAYL